MAEPEPTSEIEGQQLIDEQGNPLVGFVRVQVNDQSKVLIDEDGRVIVDGEAQFRLSRVQAADRKALRKEGANKYVQAYGAMTRSLGNVKAGYVEKPNFSLVEEMVKMIEVSRAYEANSKVVQSHDGLLDKAVNSVGATRR
jgi:flagellar basal-body rod protein FlgG